MFTEDAPIDSDYSPYLVRNESCVQGSEGVDEVTLHLDDVLPLVGFQGREDPQGGLNSLGFIWWDLENNNCREALPERGDSLTSEQALGLLTDDEK